MNILKNNIVVKSFIICTILSMTTMLFFFKYSVKRKKNQQFINLIKTKNKLSNKLFNESSLFISLKFPNATEFDTIINVQTNKEYSLKNIYKNQNIFINYWFLGCKGCELEMNSIEKFYNAYKNKIEFIIISNDDPKKVHDYRKKNSYRTNFYVFKSKTFPPNIKIFPTSELIIKNKSQFIFQDVGYYDSSDFYDYVNSLLYKK